MSQRNPLNERYQAEGKGQTKRSAASMKPKSKAASSVYVRSTEKTPQEKKAIRKQQRSRQAELDRMYYNPPTQEYKKLRRFWWILLGAAIVLTVAAMFTGQVAGDSNPTVMWVLLIPAYACIIGAIYIDFSKIRKVRRAYQMEMVRKHPKELKNHRVTHAANVHAENKAAAREAKKGGFSLSRVFGMKKEKQREETPAQADDAAEQEAAAKAAEDAKKPIAQLKAEREAAKKASESEEA